MVIMMMTMMMMMVMILDYESRYFNVYDMLNILWFCEIDFEHNLL